MSYESSKAHFLNYCQHYPRGGGSQRTPTCKAGVNFEQDFEQVRSSGQYPCIVSYGCTDKCSKFVARSEAEAEAYAQRVQDKMQQMRERAVANLCIHCGMAVARRVQVGRCIYLEPCGHRLGQGKI